MNNPIISEINLIMDELKKANPSKSEEKLDFNTH